VQESNTSLTSSGALTQREMLLTEMLFDLRNSKDAEQALMCVCFAHSSRSWAMWSASWCIHSLNAGGGGFGAPEDGEAADYREGENQGVEKAVADRAAKWVKEHSAAVRSGGSVARYTSEQESA